MLPSIDDYRKALGRHPRLELPPLPGRKNHLTSGVLVPLVWRANDIDCILTVRARHLRNHGGEVSFPGGRPEPGEHLETTALREAAEELAIAEAEILGPLSSVPLYTSDYRLFPFVAAVPEQTLVPSPDEVAEVLTVGLGALLALDHFDGIAWDIDGMRGITPVFEIADHLVYGATAHTLFELLLLSSPLFGRAAPAIEPGRFEWEEVLRRQQGR